MSTELSSHWAMIARIQAACEADARVLGLWLGGSFAHGAPDAYSDIDLVLVCEDEAHAALLVQAEAFAAQAGDLIGFFRGDHVGEPRLFIALYDQPLLHVDFKWVALSEAHIRVEEPRIIWTRDHRVSDALARAPAEPPRVDADWIEARFWVWVHYIAVKILRAEWFEVKDAFAFLRARVIAPMLTRRAGRFIQGVRRIETLGPHAQAAMAALDPPGAREACLTALASVMDLYVELRGDAPPQVANIAAEERMRGYVNGLLAGAPDPR